MDLGRAVYRIKVAVPAYSQVFVSKQREGRLTTITPGEKVTLETETELRRVLLDEAR
jgi:hypothetical protein